MGAGCGSLVCGKVEKTQRKLSGSEAFDSNVPQLNSGETVPGETGGVTDLRELERDGDLSDKDKRLTQYNSPVNKGPTDPGYFSLAELTYYEKVKRKEADHDSLLKPLQAHIVWKQGDHLGSGSYGDVVMGLNQVSGTLMAVKKVRIEEMSGRNKSKIEALEQEISMYERLSHKNIVGYLGFEKSKNCFNIFLEYIEGRLD
jgi:hypothetical protein